jgi:hypothetical protein
MINLFLYFRENITPKEEIKDLLEKYPRTFAYVINNFNTYWPPVKVYTSYYNMMI